MVTDFLEHISYSSLDQFCRCPRCWFLKYQYGYKMPSSPELDLGSEVHKLIESYHISTPEETKKLANSHLEPFLTAYAEVYKNEDFDEVEKYFEVEVSHPFNDRTIPIPLVGYIDRIHNNEVHDLKTSSHKYYDTDIEQKYQPLIYSYAYRKIYGKENKFFYDVLVKNKTPKLQIIEVPITQEKIDAMLLWVFEMWDKINSMEIPSEHGDFCWNKGLLP